LNTGVVRDVEVVSLTTVVAVVADVSVVEVLSDVEDESVTV